MSKFEADLGLTEIYMPLEDAYWHFTSSELPKHIYLLTDGCVENTDDILNLIYSYKSKVTLNAIGIGSDVSTELIIEAAKFGRGKHFFVNDRAEGLNT